MSIYPNILDISACNTMLARYPSRQQTPTQNNYQPPQHHFDHHHLSEVVVDFFSHMFATASYLQCTSSIPCWSSPSSDEQATKPKFVVDDDMVLLDAEEDGGPLCREATIASWKARPVQKERRRGLQWLAAVIKKEGA